MALAACLVVACAPGDRDDGDDAIPSGAELVESAAPAWPAGTGLHVAPRPRLSIGSGEGREAFYRVSAALRLGDGRIVVASAGSGEVRFYGPDGEFLGATGRQGDGPGEFAFLLRLVPTAGDTLIAWDAGNGGRLSRFSPTGEYLGSFALERMGEDGITQYLGSFADGTHVGQATDFPEPSTFANGGVVEMGDDAYWLFERGGSAIRTLVEVPLAPRFVQTYTEGERTGATLATMPFRRGWVVALGPDGLRVARTDRFEVRDIDRRGRVRRVARFAAQRRPLGAADVEAWVAAPPDATQRRLRRASLDAAPLPEHHPTVTRMLVDPAGHAWLRPGGPEGEDPPWQVIDADGTWLGEVAFPPSFQPYEVGAGYVLGVYLDALDVEHVQLFDLVRRDE